MCGVQFHLEWKNHIRIAAQWGLEASNAKRHNTLINVLYGCGNVGDCGWEKAKFYSMTCSINLWLFPFEVFSHRKFVFLCFEHGQRQLFIA